MTRSPFPLEELHVAGVTSRGAVASFITGEFLLHTDMAAMSVAELFVGQMLARSPLDSPARDTLMPPPPASPQGT